MQAARISELKKALKEKSHNDLLKITLRMAKFKKENKELLTYLLFEAADEEQYIRMIKEEISSGFASITASSFYLIKKSIRKTLRQTKTAIRYSQQKPTEVELLLHFVEELQTLHPSYRRSKVLRNLREGQLNRIQKIIDGLHEDLQYDYQIELENVLADG